MSNHDANSKVIISNDARFYVNRFVRFCQVDLIFAPPIEIQKDNVQITPSLHMANFTGPGVSVTEPDPILHPGEVEINIPGLGGTVPPVIVSNTSATSGSTQVDEISADLVISGLNRGSVIEISTQEDVTITGVTVGGTVATQEIVATDNVNNLRSEVWVCIAPPLGTQTVVVSLSAPAYVSFGAQCVNGVDSSTPVGSTQTATGSDTNPTLSLVTTYDNSIILDSLTTAQTPILYTPGAGQALNWSETANTVVRQGGSSVESSGLQPDNITMDYTITQSTPWCLAALELKGITTPVPPSAGVQTVSGYYVDNTDPANPIITVPKNNMTATTNPGSGNDSTQGYSIGSIWFNNTNMTCWIAQTVGVGTATWTQVLQGNGKNNPTATTNPGVGNDNTQGYSVGSMWFNNTAKSLWVAQSVGTGTAVWTQVLGSSVTGAVIYYCSSVTSSDNSGGTVVLKTYTIPSGTITDSNTVKVLLNTQIINNAGATQTINIKLNGTTVYSFTPLFNNQYTDAKVVIEIFKVSSVVYGYVNLSLRDDISNNNTTKYQQFITTINPSTTNIIVDVESVQAGAVGSAEGTVYQMKVSNV
jgi:hypothetical protein